MTRTSSPYELLQTIRQFQTMDVSALVKQDVLLLAGSEDHYVPVEQLYRQIKLLTNARSIAARLFHHWRERRQPLPGRQLRPCAEDDHQLARRHAGAAELNRFAYAPARRSSQWANTYSPGASASGA